MKTTLGGHYLVPDVGEMFRKGGTGRQLALVNVHALPRVDPIDRVPPIRWRVPHEIVKVPSRQQLRPRRATHLDHAHGETEIAWLVSVGALTDTLDITSPACATVFWVCEQQNN